MENLSIKIKISDREYPMKVSPEDEEKIRKAGKIVNEKIRIYREKFGIDDKQDLLAMVAFDCIVDKMEVEGKAHSTDESVLEKLQSINQDLARVL